MLNHDPKRRPNAAEVRTKYKKIVETLTSNTCKEPVQIEEQRFRRMEISTRHTRNRIIKRSRLRRNIAVEKLYIARG